MVYMVDCKRVTRISSTTGRNGRNRMDDNQTHQDLMKAMNQILAEMQHMNRTLSAIAAQGKPMSAEPTGRPKVGSRPPTSVRTGGYTSGRKSTRPTGGFKHSEAAPDKSEEGDVQGFRFPKKKAPARPKSGKPPARKTGGYPKKAR